MTITKESQNTSLPKWFFHVLYICGIVASIVIGWARAESISDSRLAVVETEVVQLKEEVKEAQEEIKDLKSLYLTGVTQIKANTDEIYKLLQKP